MSLQKGNTTFRVGTFDADLDLHILEAFAEGAISADWQHPPVGGENCGWSSPRYPVDRDLDAPVCFHNPYMHLALTSVTRKVPPKLLRVFCAQEEHRIMKENGVDSLSRAQRKEIRDVMLEQLEKKMPPTIKSIDLGIDLAKKLIFTDATSDKQNDALALHFAESTHSALVNLTPHEVAERIFHVQMSEVEPAVFTPEAIEFSVNEIGFDFLTWLYWCFETGRNRFDTKASEAGVVEVSLDGPVSLMLDGEGAHLITLRDGDPLGSNELKTALLAGKKISAINLIINEGEDTYSANVTGTEFIFRSFKAPKLDDNRPEIDIFADRMEQMKFFTKAVFDIYGAFLAERFDPAAWRKTEAAIRKWLPEIETRA